MTKDKTVKTFAEQLDDVQGVWEDSLGFKEAIEENAKVNDKSYTRRSAKIFTLLLLFLLVSL